MAMGAAPDCMFDLTDQRKDGIRRISVLRGCFLQDKSAFLMAGYNTLKPDG